MDNKIKDKEAVIISKDYRLLKKLVTANPHNESLERLRGKLQLVKPAPDDADTADLVTLNSFVKVLDLHTNRTMEFKLVMPHAANASQRKFSILTPIGTALLGHNKGDSVAWTLQGGHREVTVLEVA